MFSEQVALWSCDSCSQVVAVFCFWLLDLGFFAPGSSDDVVFGNAGKDTVYAGLGDDVIYGGLDGKQERRR